MSNLVDAHVEWEVSMCTACTILVSHIGMNPEIHPRHSSALLTIVIGVLFCILKISIIEFCDLRGFLEAEPESWRIIILCSVACGDPEIVT